MNKNRKSEIAYRMSQSLGVVIDPENVIEVPHDGCPGHLVAKNWKVFAARCGEFTLVAYDFGDNNIDIKVI